MRTSRDTGKEDCRIIDFVDSTSRVSGVMSTPTLFGLDPDQISVDGESPTESRLPFKYLSRTDETVESLEQRAAEAIGEVSVDSGDPIPQPKSVTYLDYENPFSLVNASSGEPQIAKLSSNAWVGCGDNIYVLECLGKGHIRIEPVAANEGAPLRISSNISLLIL